MAATTTKTDNHPQARAAKITIRQKVLDAIGKNAAVFDAFAGSGEMFSAVWKQAKSYTGCDLKPQRDSRLMFCADNTRVLRAIDLSKFSILTPTARPGCRPSSCLTAGASRQANGSA